MCATGSELSHGREERVRLALLKQVLEVLQVGLSSLAGRPPPTPEARYLGWVAAFVNRAADGYLCLRESFRVPASKILVRPILESVFSAAAILKEPGLFSRKAYTEWDDDRRTFVRDEQSQREAAAALARLRESHRERHPSLPYVEKRVTTKLMAEKAGIPELYLNYRIYCNFSHGALRAATGDLDNGTNHLDTITVIWGVLMILRLLKTATPADVPDLGPFEKQLVDPAI